MSVRRQSGSHDVVLIERSVVAKRLLFPSVAFPSPGRLREARLATQMLRD
jgi:hypothetical protein